MGRLSSSTSRSKSQIEFFALGNLTLNTVRDSVTWFSPRTITWSRVLAQFFERRWTEPIFNFSSRSRSTLLPRLFFFHEAVISTRPPILSSRTVTTDADGGYTFPNLPVGPYQLQVRKQGFSAYVQTGIVLQVNV
jgi:hypothetical protein